MNQKEIWAHFAVLAHVTKTISTIIMNNKILLNKNILQSHYITEAKQDNYIFYSFKN